MRKFQNKAIQQKTQLSKNESFQNQITNRINNIQIKIIKTFESTLHHSCHTTRICIRKSKNHENNKCQKIQRSELHC